MLDYGLDMEGRGTPYTGVSAYNPDADLMEYSIQVDALTTLMQARAPQTDVEAYLDGANARATGDITPLDINTVMSDIRQIALPIVDEVVIKAIDAAAQAGNDAVQTAALTAFNARQRAVHSAEVNRFVAGMVDGNAVQSSAFVLGLALLESSYEDRSAQYDADFTLPMMREAFTQYIGVFMEQVKEHLVTYVQNNQVEQQLEVEYTLRGSQLMLEALRAQLVGQEALARVSIEGNRIKIVAKSEEYDHNLEYDVKDLMWDPMLFQAGVNMVSGISGAVVTAQPGPSRVQSAIGGAASGAALGAYLAAPTGGLSVGAGAAIGGLAGLLAGSIQ